MLVLAALCLADAQVRVSLFNTTFQEGRDLVHQGALGQFVSVCALLSKISITSRLAQNSFLFDSTRGSFSVRDSHFDGLANSFGHFSGGKVLLDSTSFRRSVRPVTADYDCDGQTEAGRVKEENNVNVRNCTFVGLTSQTDPEGGAIRVSGDVSLTITGDESGKTEFRQCSSTNGWAAAVYAHVSSFQCDWVLCEDMSTGYSVLHIEHNELGTFAPVTMSHLEFNRITITPELQGAEQIQGGGSGLVIRYVSSLELSDCEFSSCTFTDGNDQKKRAGALMFEQPESRPFEKLSFVRCISTKTSGRTGCIYVNNPVTNFTIDDFTIEDCNGIGSDSFAIDVKANAPTITKLRMKDMDDGHGKIWLGQITAAAVDFTECEFRNYSTPRLFYREGNPVHLTLSSCIFNTVVSSDLNLISLRDQKFSELTISGCTFEGITAKWALVIGQSGTCTIDSDTSFKDVSIEGGQYGREPILFFKESPVTSVTLNGVSFDSINEVGGILRIDTEAANPTVSISDVKCNQISLSALFSIVSTNILTFDTCTFTNCTSTASAIVELHNAPESGVKKCVFDFCATSVETAAILKVMYGELLLESCEFRSMTSLVGIPVSIEASGEVSIAGNVTFDQVTLASEQKSLIEVNQSATVSVSLNMSISNCQFSALVSCPVTQATVTGTFSKNHVNTLFDVSDSLTLNDCQFNGSTGQLIHSSVLSLTGCEFHGNTVSDGPLISVTSSVTMEGCCFQGTSSAFYLQIEGGATVTAAYPLCFDRKQSESVSFSDSDPFEKLTGEYQIFECSTCGAPATVEPTSDPESEDEGTTYEESEDEGTTYEETLSPTTSSSGNEGGKKGKLDGGAIAGIVIAILVVVAVVVVLLVVFLGRRKKEEGSEPTHDDEMNEENPEETVTSVAGLDEWAGKTTEDSPLFTTGDDSHGEDDDNIFEENWT